MVRGVCVVACRIDGDMFHHRVILCGFGASKDIFAGFLPSRAVFEGDGLYLSLAILGATVMPHSLYLGSGVVQPRLRDYDIKKGYYKPDDTEVENNHENYRPSLDAIKDTLSFIVAELLVSHEMDSLSTVDLIVSGATLYGTTQNSQEADLFSIYNLLCDTLSKAAGTVFALALLFSGQSAGIVCTLSGQMVSEGFLNWTIAPVLRRSATRAVAITPCLILVLVAGRNGLSGALNASQVVLSLLLPFVSAPLIYFTSSKRIMRVAVNNNCSQENKSRLSPQPPLPPSDLNKVPLLSNEDGSSFDDRTECKRGTHAGTREAHSRSSSYSRESKGRSNSGRDHGRCCCCCLYYYYYYHYYQ